MTCDSLLAQLGDKWMSLISMTVGPVRSLQSGVQVLRWTSDCAWPLSLRGLLYAGSILH